MSIQIIITDPTRDEALRLADYLFELAGYGKKDGIVAHERVGEAVSHRFETTPAQVADQLKSQIEAMVASDDTDVALPPMSGTDPLTGTTWAVTDTPQTLDAVTYVPPPPTGHHQRFDSAAHAWDARIHASSHATVADGTWRLRRNLDPKVLEAVLAERGAMLPAETDADVLPPPVAGAKYTAHASHPATFDAAGYAALFATSDVPPAPGAWPFPSDVPPPPVTASIGVPPPPPPATGTLTFAAFMQRVTAAIGAGTIAQTDVAAALAEYGVASIPLLASVHTDKIDAIAARLGV